MNNKLLIILAFFLISSKSFGQFGESNIIITTEGLSETYAARFKSNKNKTALADVLNQLDITGSIRTIKIFVTYENGEGDVMAEIIYNHDKISSDQYYSGHIEQSKRWGVGVSVYLAHQLFAALSQYKKSVATKDYSMDRDLLSFSSTVRFKKTNGDFVSFYAYNYLDSQGFYPYSFYTNSHIRIEGEIYETETTDNKILNGMKFFKVGKTTGLDGNKTGSYYLCQFFNVSLR